MTGDTDRDGGPTPAEARRLLPELTAAVLTGEPLSAAIPRLQAGIAELALHALLRRWWAAGAAECAVGRCGRECAGGGPCDGVWRAGVGYAGLVTLVAVRECRDVLSGDDAA